MNKLRTYSPSLFTALLLAVILICIYPYYQYYIDPDATAYLTIAKRYASGDIAKAVNGYWSPWGCWFTALLIKAGAKPFCAAIAVNATGAVGFIFISQSLFILSGIRRSFQNILTIALGIFLCYAIFKQSFDDLWECFFLLTSLRIMLADDYNGRPGLWIWNGFIGALAYFAKAYAFPFFILNVACCSYLLSPNRGQWVRMCAITVLAMLIFSCPWIYMLHEKYGRWMTSTAGGLNMSWYLVGHPYWKAGIQTLVPPIYADSPYYWEDPFLVNGVTPHFWDSVKLFLLQAARGILNIVKFIRSGCELSVCFIPAWLAGIYFIKYRQLQPPADKRITVLILSFLLFPLGYILVNFEARYIWFMLPLSMVIAVIALQKFAFPKISDRKKMVVLFALAASYLIYPVYDMKCMFREGEADYHMAQQLKAAGISGSFTANVVYGRNNVPGVARLAYFSGNSYYNMPSSNVTTTQLLADMRRYRVKYYFYYPQTSTGADFIFPDEQGQAFPEVSGGKWGKVKIFLVNP